MNALARWMLLLITVLPAAAMAVGAPVTVSQQADFFMLTNGRLQAKVDRRNGELVSLRSGSFELLDNGRHAGYWSHAPGGEITSEIVTDPRSNGGSLAQVIIRGLSHGQPSGGGPGGSVIADISIRYALPADSSIIYTSCTFDHPANYPATSVGEARYCLKLNDSLFDWMTVDADRNLEMITAADWNHGTTLNMKEARLMNTGLLKGHIEHKYDYAANIFDTRTWGWSSTRQHIGLWLINPSTEYLGGGPTKVELTAHRDSTVNKNADAPAPPVILNYWRGSHYGGTECAISEGEHWNKVIGPFGIYVNEGGTANDLWKDAQEQSRKQSTLWPYGWCDDVNYPSRNDRGSVVGRIEIKDPLATSAAANLRVGLTAASDRVDAETQKPAPDWQLDAKHYQFWMHAEADGSFNIQNVRPGNYIMHAIADGVLGELVLPAVHVAAGQRLDLHGLVWTPERFGKQIWEIGVPNRSASEFRHGDHFWQWGLYNQYPTDFPDDVHFIIGQSDYRRDWNYCQCPRADRPNGTTWTVVFDRPQPETGTAVLRLALSGVSAKRISIEVNDQPAGDTGLLRDNATIRRDGIAGYWSEHDIRFNAALLHTGRNTLKLIIPPGNAMSGIEYDYLRLEISAQQ